MEALTESGLETAQHRWEAQGSNSYHLLVRVAAAHLDTAVYEVVVRGGEAATIKRDGEPIQLEYAEDYSISGLFHLLRQELRLMDRSPSGAPVTLAHTAVRFDPETGRLDRYRRTATRSQLQIDVLKYEPDAGDPR